MGILSNLARAISGTSRLRNKAAIKWWVKEEGTHWVEGSSPLLISEDEIIIGRATGAEKSGVPTWGVRSFGTKVAIGSSTYSNQSISRKHCKITWDNENNQYNLVVISKFGVKVKGLELSRGQKVNILNKEVIQIPSGSVPLVKLQFKYFKKK